MALRNKAALLALCTIAGPAPGCTAIADLDSFDRAPVCDVDLHLREMDLHTDNLVEVRGMSEDDRLRALARLDPLASPDVDIRMPNVIPEGPHRIDFFADLNNNRMYDNPMADHTWRIADPCTDPPKVFEHVFDFEPLPEPAGPGNDLTMTFEQMQVGVAFELHVVEPATEERNFARTVGLYRVASVPDPDPDNGDDFDGTFSVELPGIIEAGTTYEIELWSDRNGNGEYEPPDTDEAWRLTDTGGETGLDLEFTRIEEYFDIGGILVGVP